MAKDPLNKFASPYIYAGNNPVGFIDLFGLSPLGVGGDVKYTLNGNDIPNEQANYLMSMSSSDSPVYKDPIFNDAKSRANGHWGVMSFYNKKDKNFFDHYTGEGYFGLVYVTPVWIPNTFFGSQLFYENSGVDATNSGDGSNTGLVISGIRAAGIVASRSSINSLSGFGESVSTGASLVLTTNAISQIGIGKGSIANYADATVGITGLLAKGSLYFSGIEVPGYGELVVLYGCARFGWDAGASAANAFGGPWTWCHEWKQSKYETPKQSKVLEYMNEH